jgi:hypothetical protein
MTSYARRESGALNTASNAIIDYEVNKKTITGEDFEIVVALNGSGGIFALDPDTTDPQPKRH